MLRKRFPFLLDPSFLSQRFLRRSSTILALAVALLPAAWAQPKFKILATVPGGLFTGLTFDAKGNLYGGTGGGGDHNDGTIFQLTPGPHGWSLTTLHSFDGTDGGTPNGGLIFDAAGDFYGTASAGGTGGGTAFKMTPDAGGWVFSVLYEFCLQYHCPDGSHPSGLVMDGLGNLYGTATGGGSYDGGIVFELTPASGSWNETLLHSFNGADGSYPYSALIFDKVGNLYGTASRGGAYGEGAVFKLRRVSGDWKELVLYSFCSMGFPCEDGLDAYDGLVFDGLGNLYGTTNQGGSNTCGETHCGTVFKLTPTRTGHWKHTVLYDFPEPANGSNPTSGVIFGKAGNLYGTAGGGSGSCSGGCGVVYKLTPSTGGKWKYTVLHEFTGQDGFYPDGGVVLDGKGNVYGTAYDVVYEITP